MRREFLMLANIYNRERSTIGGWYASEKLDGIRALWDGGITRGMFKDEVPWANTLKDSRYQLPQRATGLWTRYGHVIHAPDWFLDNLPRDLLLDGELWCGYRDWQRLTSIVKDLVPSLAWNKVEYHVFACPTIHSVFCDGEIKNTNYKKMFTGIIRWIESRNYFKKSWPSILDMYGEQTILSKCNGIKVLTQHKLPYTDAEKKIDELLSEQTEKGGEGLVLRNPASIWIPKRVNTLLKVKELHDAEGTITGYKSGRETDLGSKLLGMIGAIVVKLDTGITFDLSGFTDEERMFADVDMRKWAFDNPDCYVPDWCEGLLFKRGERITFRYRELSTDGKPKEARYWRKRNTEA